MLRVAVPNKGSLSETAAAMLVEAGYGTRRDARIKNDLLVRLEFCPLSAARENGQDQRDDSE